MISAAREIAAKVAILEHANYRCTECGRNFGDPDGTRSFILWATSVREHLMEAHKIATRGFALYEAPNSSSHVISDFLRAEYA